MKKILLPLLLMILFSAALYSQATVPAGEPDPARTGVTTAQQKLKEVSVNKFEDAGFWYGMMPADEGIISVRRFEGSPLDKEPIEDEEVHGIVEEDKFVLGTKISFYRRGVASFGIRPVRPIPIEGITKTISVWIAGRNTNHVLELVIEDHFGNEAYINMGKLNFSGWKKITVSVPPNIIQRDYHYNNKMGIMITGFNVECEIDETYGNYYIYFDDLRAVTDVFAEENRDLDDMSDSW
ncbi:MAG: flagellar filament protein FlaA [Calditrichaeota bacterium]|nr:MAG: flagellar filament protein FlaA [Calditrichota bacterium]